MEENEVMMKMFGTERRVTPRLTMGVDGLGIPMNTLFKLHRLAMSRWVKDKDDYFTAIRPAGINVEVTNGNEVIDTLLVSDLPNISDQLYIVVDDYGEQSEEGLVITILLPAER